MIQVYYTPFDTKVKLQALLFVT